MGFLINYKTSVECGKISVFPQEFADKGPGLCELQELFLNMKLEMVKA